MLALRGGCSLRSAQLNSQIQGGADFGDEIGRQRDKCLRTRLEKRQFRVFYANARQNWSVAGSWKAPWTKTELELRFANRLVPVLVQIRTEWKFRFTWGRRIGRARCRRSTELSCGNGARSMSWWNAVVCLSGWNASSRRSMTSRVFFRRRSSIPRPSRRAKRCCA